MFDPEYIEAFDLPVRFLFFSGSHDLERESQIVRLS